MSTPPSALPKRRQTSRVLAALLGVLVVGATSGCDGGVGPLGDGGPVRDAAVADGGGLLDGGPIDAAGPRIDGAIDAGAAVCADPICDPRNADGCSEGACSLWGAEASCEPVPGSLGPGATCVGVGECAPGLACFRVGGVGQCSSICCPGDGSACADGASCGGSGVLIDGTTTEWGRCLARRTCDVLDPSVACEAREGCYIVDGSGTTECQIAGTAGAGEACAVQQDCAGGFFCGGIGSAKRCVRICEIGADDCPVAEGRCVAQAHTPAGSGLCTFDAMTARAQP